MHHPRAVGLALAVTAAVSFGAGPIFARGLYDLGLDWPTVVFWRFAIAAAASWAWLLARSGSRRALRSLSRRRLAALAGIGAMMVGNTSAYYAAIERVPVSLAALVQAIYPALTTVLSTRFGHVARGPRPWIALALAIGGVVLVIGGVQTGGDPVGLALAVASPVLYSLVLILSARVAGERRGVTATHRTGGVPDTDSAVAAAVMLTAGAAAILALSALLGRPADLIAVPPSAWAGLLALGLVSGAIALQATYAAMARIGAAQVALVATLEPVTAVLLAAAVLGEQLEPLQMLGGAIVLAGVILAQTAPAPRTPHPSARGDPAGVPG